MFVLPRVQVRVSRAGPARFFLVQERIDPPGVGTLRWTQVLKFSRDPIAGLYKRDPETRALVYAPFPWKEAVAAATAFLLSQDGINPVVDTLNPIQAEETKTDDSH